MTFHTKEEQLNRYEEDASRLCAALIKEIKRRGGRVAYIKGSDTPYNWTAYYRGQESYPKDLEYREEPYVRITTLWENRIYPYAGMTVEKLVGLV